MNSIIFILTSLLNSFLVLILTSGFNIRFIIGDLLIILVITGFSYLFKRRNLYLFIWSIILTIICIVNSIYFNEYNDFVSVVLFETFFQALRLPSGAITSVFESVDFIFIYQPILFLIILLFDKKKYNINKTKFKNSISSSLILFVMFILTLNQNDIYMIKHEWNKVYKARNFGIYSYQLSDIIYNIYNAFPHKYNNIDNINNYFSSKKIKTNEYTNIFKDKNVIFIHAESIQAMFLDESINGEVITPNLNKLKQEGIYFSNFYSQESVGTSSDTEYTFYNSLLPIGVGTTFLNYTDNTFNTIQSSLKNSGYYVFNMHGNSCNYWNRSNIYKNFSIDNYYCYDIYDLTDKLGLGLSDKSFFSQSADIINNVSDNKFSATLIMLSNHTPFITNDSTDFDVDYLEGTLIGDYIKLLHYADDAIGEFIDKLSSYGLLDNTVVVIYGDHDAKIKKKYYDLYYNYNKDESDYVDIDFYKYEEISKVPLIIWTKDKTFNVDVEEVMGMIDLYPTIANMLGLEYKNLLGNDIFSVDENIVVFPNGNWVTNKVYYNSQYNEYKEYKKVDSNYIKEKNNYARNIVEISNDILKYNLELKLK